MPPWSARALRNSISPTNLTSSPNRFVGRASELKAIHHHLESGARLLTLVGAPGIGKSRLAAEYVRDHCDLSRWSGGRFVCDLTDAECMRYLGIDGCE